MFLTIEKTNKDTETFGECFDYLRSTLENHYLLTAGEREECVKAVDKLKQVFARFYEKRK